jgi:hypothetical protein
LRRRRHDRARADTEPARLARLTGRGHDAVADTDDGGTERRRDVLNAMDCVCVDGIGLRCGPG